MNRKFLKFCPVSLLLLSASLLPCGAQTINVKNRVIQRVNVQLTGYAAGEFVSDGDIDTTRFKKFRVTTKDLLALMSRSTGEDFFNTDLVVTNLNFGRFLVVRGTRILADVSDLVTVQDETGGGVRRGSLDTYSGRARQHRLLIGTFDFQDFLGNTINLRALITERISASSVDDRGDQQVSDIVVMKASGTGRMLGGDAIFTGTIIAAGKGNFKHQ